MNALKEKIKVIRDIARDIILQPELIYRFYLCCRSSFKTNYKKPLANWNNCVLKTTKEWENAVKQVKEIGLPITYPLYKNWDGLAAVSFILENTQPSARILDAGCELSSNILPWLFLYGYKNLTGINITFQSTIKRGPITYQSGDITNTHFENNTFDAIVSQSVIEHGVNIKAYFKEASRILNINGILITSTDYFETPIDTKGKAAFGAPVHIFSKDEILEIIRTAEKYNLKLTDKICLNCIEKPVHWIDLNYTFIIFTMKKG